MALISGASGFLNSAMLANQRGQSASAPSLLGNSSVSLLDVGKRLSPSGIGLSSRARALTNSFLSNTSSVGNALLSAPAEANSTKNLQKQILALRSSLPASSLSRSVLSEGSEENAGESDNLADNPFLDVSRGNNVDTSA